jgi:hypothetical protein
MSVWLGGLKEMRTMCDGLVLLFWIIVGALGQIGLFVFGRIYHYCDTETIFLMVLVCTMMATFGPIRAYMVSQGIKS